MLSLKSASVASCQDVNDVAFAIMYAYRNGTSLKTIRKLLCLDTDSEGLTDIRLEFSPPSYGTPPKPITLELCTEDANFIVELTEKGCPVLESWDTLFINKDGFTHKCFKLPPLAITVQGQTICQIYPSLFDVVKTPIACSQRTLLFGQLIPGLPNDSPFLSDTPPTEAILCVHTAFSSLLKTSVRHLELWLDVPDLATGNASNMRLSYSIAYQPITPDFSSNSQDMELENGTGYPGLSELPGLAEFQRLFAGAHSLLALCTQFPQWDTWLTTAMDPYIFEEHPRKQRDIFFFLREIYRLEIDLVAAGRPAARTAGKGSSAFHTILIPCFQALGGQPFSYSLYLQTIQHHCLAKIEAHQLQTLSC